jgi:hypothetical protein
MKNIEKIILESNSPILLTHEIGVGQIDKIKNICEENDLSISHLVCKFYPKFPSVDFLLIESFFDLTEDLKIYFLEKVLSQTKTKVCFLVDDYDEVTKDSAILNRLILV